MVAVKFDEFWIGERRMWMFSWFSDFWVYSELILIASSTLWYRTI